MTQRICKRCGNAYSYSYDSLLEVGVKFPSGEDLYCDECKSYRKKKLSEAIELYESRLIPQDETCFQCNGRGYMGRNRLRCDRCSGKGTQRIEEGSNYEFKWNILGGIELEPKSEIKKELPKDYDKKKHLCFITTSCVESKGLKDNCEQLNILRDFRDNYLKRQENGLREIQEYYEIAPGIVRAINSGDDSRRVYEQIYERDIRTAIALIQRGNYDVGHNHYKEMVLRLKKEIIG